MRARRKWGAFLAPLLGFALIASACGDDSGDSTTPGASTTAAAPSSSAGGASSTAAGSGNVATVAGCEKRGYSKPDDLSATRQVARCDVGTPAPKPLPQKEKVVLASNFKLEFNSPIGLAMS